MDAHSGVVSAEETGFFTETFLRLGYGRPLGVIPMLDSLTGAAVREAREDYLRRMEAFVGAPTSDLLLIDKNPSLITLLPMILHVFPQVQLIVALRDPRDVCLSCFMQPLRPSPVTAMYLTLEQTVEEYCAVMSYWQAIKPLLPNPALEVRYEAVVADVQVQAERTLQFLKLDWEPAVLRFAERSSKSWYARPRTRRSRGPSRVGQSDAGDTIASTWSLTWTSWLPWWPPSGYEAD